MVTTEYTEARQSCLLLSKKAEMVIETQSARYSASEFDLRVVIMCGNVGVGRGEGLCGFCMGGRI